MPVGNVWHDVATFCLGRDLLKNRFFLSSQSCWELSFTLHHSAHFLLDLTLYLTYSIHHLW